MKKIVTNPLIFLFLIFLQILGATFCPIECRCGQIQAYCSGLPVDKIGLLSSDLTTL